MADDVISFRPVEPDDLSILRAWMHRPHWREWWGDPDQEISYIKDMIEGRDTTRPFLILRDKKPCGYIQVWFIADNRHEPWLTAAPWLLELPDHAVGVDLSLSDDQSVGKGFGSRALAAFVARLHAEGHDEIWIDPDPANLRAVRAYQKAGFREHPVLGQKYADCLLMRHLGPGQHQDLPSSPTRPYLSERGPSRHKP